MMLLIDGISCLIYPIHQQKTIQKEVFILQNPKTEETITRVNGAALLQL